jgi:hypothetical protein
VSGGRAVHGEVRAVLCRAVELYRGHEAGHALRQELDRMDGPLRVAVAGKVKAGKSTLLNALVGEEIAPTDAGECTRVVTWYRYGQQPRVTLHPVTGPLRQLSVHREHGALRLELGGVSPDTVDRLTVDWPAASLRDTVLIDTPGVASASTDIAAHAVRFLAPEEGAGDADAVIYLMRHLHSTDVRLLESFHDNAIGRGNPLNTVAVLSRADEVGVGRLDALQSAHRIAERYRSDERLRGLCGTVVPVAGLLAQAGRTMRQQEFAALAALSGAPRSVVEGALLSVDRFTSATQRVESALGVPAAHRAALLDRFGLFGIRLATVLLRQGFGQPHELAAELVRRSGVDELRTALVTRFTERRDLLKARAALLALDDVLRRYPHPDAELVSRAVERIQAGAHEFAELRVLGALRVGVIGLAPEAGREAERLLGGLGCQPWARLGLGADASRPQQRSVAMAALQRWQARAEHPLSGRASIDVARVVMRTCEGLCRASDTGGPGAKRLSFPSG